MRTGNRENACSKFTYTTEKEARVVLYKCKNSSSLVHDILLEEKVNAKFEFENLETWDQ